MKKLFYKLKAKFTAFFEKLKAGYAALKRKIRNLWN